MFSRDTDLTALEPVKRIPKQLRHAFNTCVVIGGLVGGGVSIGYFLGVQQTKADARAEIERLQSAYGVRLERAASATTNAAEAVSTAAEAVGEAAASAATAATAAKTAVAAVKATNSPPPVHPPPRSKP